MLEAVPNFSEGRDEAVIEALRGSLSKPARLLDVHVDADHHRSVFTLVGEPEQLVETLLTGIVCARKLIDLRRHEGAHPRTGAADVVPIVPIVRDDMERARETALELARRIGEELGLPVFLYGELATREEQRERAFLRRGGRAALAARIESGELVPDYGPRRLHPTGGALLAGARPPLVAFNVDLESADLELAQRIAAGLRESGGGLPGVRALGVFLEHRGRAQVTTNIHDYRATPLHMIVEAVREQAPIAEAELVGLAPEAAFQRFPEDVPLRGFSPERHLIENVLRSLR
jgi:glutamate formiminotransferase / 5-formyltetrahydrofolate cyclo-ligase